MSGTIVRVLYETTPETVGRLSRRLLPVAAAMEIRKTDLSMYLEVSFDDAFFNIRGENAGGEKADSGKARSPSFKEVTNEFEQGDL